MLPEFGIWLQDFSKLAIIQKMTTASPFANMTSASIFLTVFVSLVKFSYWPKFHVNTSLVLEKAGERGEERGGFTLRRITGGKFPFYIDRDKLHILPFRKSEKCINFTF